MRKPSCVAEVKARVLLKAFGEMPIPRDSDIPALIVLLSGLLATGLLRLL